MPQHDSSDAVIRPHQVMLLRQRDLMGRPTQSPSPSEVVKMQRSQGQGDAFSFLSRGYAPLRENVSEQDQIVIEFPAQWMDLRGELVLLLAVSEGSVAKITQSQTAAPVSLRDAHLSRRGGQVHAALMVDGEPEFEYRWGYSRHSGLRRACRPLDDTPGSAAEHWTYHATWLNQDPQSLRRCQDPVSNEARITFTQREIEEVRRIDLCESVLDRLDQRFSTGEYLHWNAAIVDKETVQRELESAGAPVHILFRQDAIRWTIGKAVRPTIEFSVTLVTDSGELRCAMIGLSTF
jgi:hypothetical protein